MDGGSYFLLAKITGRLISLLFSKKKNSNYTVQFYYTIHSRNTTVLSRHRSKTTNVLRCVLFFWILMRVCNIVAVKGTKL